MTSTPGVMPGWVQAAGRLPVAFAQVREDPVIDRWVVKRCAAGAGERIRMLQIASGGCTAAMLATMPEIAHLHLVDPNPAQLALTRLKLALLRSISPGHRLALLGHRPLAAAQRGQAFEQVFAELELATDALGSFAELCRLGADHFGRYEMVFAALRQHLAPRAADLASLLELRDPAEQCRRAASTTPLGQDLDNAFAEVMRLQHLAHLFGEQATQNAAMPFAEHFAARTRIALSSGAAACNPFLWQILLGRYPETLPIDWLLQPAQAPSADIAWSQGTMDGMLEGSAHHYHCIHLSNILDWLTSAQAAHTLALTRRALRPGGWVVIRQLNSTLDIPALDPGFRWQTDLATTLHVQDRSFFYRQLHLGCTS